MDVKPGVPSTHISLVDVKNPAMSFAKSRMSYHLSPEQITDSCHLHMNLRPDKPVFKTFPRQPNKVGTMLQITWAIKKSKVVQHSSISLRATAC